MAFNQISFRPLRKEHFDFLSRRSAKILRANETPTGCCRDCLLCWKQRREVPPIQQRSDAIVKRELGIARCGPACCLCTENENCGGCDRCAQEEECVNRRCTLARGLGHCYECPDAGECEKGLLGKVKPRAFTRFARAHGEAALLDRLEAGERDGMVYHRVGVEGDYDAFPSAEALIAFLESGCRPPCANGGKMV